MTKQELLAVLDLPEEKHEYWCLVNADMRGVESLADMAFRLRDEAVKQNRGNDWQKAKVCVWLHLGRTMIWDNYAKPIHFIIAALIAKQMAKEK